MLPLAATNEPPALTKADFERVAANVYRLAGIVLRTGKEDLVESRLNKRLRAKKIGSFREYLDLVDRDPVELAAMVDALTTNKTAFLREPAHFDLLIDLLKNAWSSAGQIRIWSSACSTGEEPYTIAMTILDNLPHLAPRVRILATDLASHAVARSRAGEYANESLGGLPPQWLGRYFDKAPSGAFRIKAEVKRMVRFARLNLLDPWPMRGPFQVIFCRNVMIYFDKPTQLKLAGRFRELLSSDGYLLIGHSESLGSEGHALHYVKPAVYRRCKPT